MKLTFYGGARSVTGANYLLESGDAKILIDCGLHQGSHYSEDLNFQPFPYNPKDINFVCITHAHIDHLGRVPQLVKSGFSGEIYSTPPTKDVAEFLLLDAENILREEANERSLPPIYTETDIVKAMGLWHKKSYHEKFLLGPFEVELYDAGHVLGSASVVVRAEGKVIVFSGDLGNIETPFIKPIEDVPIKADAVLIESAYGGRIHEKLFERKAELETIIKETAKKSGTLLIPAFALERTQEMIFELNDLVENGSVPRIPVYIDSPLAIKLTSVYQKYSRDPNYFNKSALGQIFEGDDIFNFPNLHMTVTQEESKGISKIPPPKIIIAGAGMSQGGRIREHEKRYLSDDKNTILFVGFQAKGSLGRGILEGEKEVLIGGEKIKIRARVESISGYSAHADQTQLVRWLSSMNKVEKVFVVQGEDNESESLSDKIKKELSLDSRVPSFGESVMI